jgi:hypothetical protein
MPFDKAFNDIYKFGIKDASDDAGAYAERVDEQMYDESILDRIFNQINKADLIVADMTGRNPNVFYEVGYAHALQKLVLLITQKEDDIPFDLKQRPHILYGGEIATLKEKLTAKIKWGIGEAERAVRPLRALLDATILGHPVPEVGSGAPLTVISGSVGARIFALPVLIRNASREMSPPISHIYLSSKRGAALYPIRYVVPPSAGVSVLTWQPGKVPERLTRIDVPGSRGAEVQSRLEITIPALPTDALEEQTISLQMSGEVAKASETFRLRLHSSAGAFEYPFQLDVSYVEPKKELVSGPTDRSAGKRRVAGGSAKKK